VGPDGSAADLFPGPAVADHAAAGATDEAWGGMSTAVWKFIVRPIAVGGMFVGACYTLFRMRASLAIGMKAGHFRPQEVGFAGRIHAAHPARSQCQGGIRGDWRDVPVHDALYFYFAAFSREPSWRLW